MVKHKTLELTLGAIFLYLFLALCCKCLLLLLLKLTQLAKIDGVGGRGVEYRKCSSANIESGITGVWRDVYKKDVRISNRIWFITCFLSLVGFRQMGF